MKKPNLENDWMGWVGYLEKRRKELCAEALGITEWGLPTIHEEYLSNLFLASISLRLSTEEVFFRNRKAMQDCLGRDMQTAFSLAFDEQLTLKQREQFLSQLGFVVENFGKDKRRTKVKELEILMLLCEFLAHEKWPTNKELVEKSKYYGRSISAKKISDFTESESILLPKAKTGRKSK